MTRLVKIINEILNVHVISTIIRVTLNYIYISMCELLEADPLSFYFRYISGTTFTRAKFHRSSERNNQKKY